MIKKIGIAVAIVVVVALLIVLGYAYLDAQPPSTAAEPLAVIPSFHEVTLDFEHRFDADRSLPFLGSAIIDVDGDGTEEVFLGGGFDQPDGLFRFDGRGFVDIAAASGLSKDPEDTTYGALSVDVDDDRQVDLFVTRDSGLYLYRNQGGRFVGQKLDVSLHPDSLGLSLTAADLDRDGQVDLYVAAYLRPDKVKGLTIFNDPTYGGRSVLLMGRGTGADGSLIFEDVTEAAGLAYIHNTFQGVFSDVDGDGHSDLVVAHDTGQVRTWRNRGAGGVSFEQVDNPTSNVYAYPMGVAVGDYDGDGRIDYFFSNTGSTVPMPLARGDLRDDQVLDPKWFLFRNAGDFRFEDRADSANLADYEFSWGAVFDDWNLDGRQDLAVAEGFIDWPLQKAVKLPGRLLIQNPDRTFAPIEDQAGAEANAYGISPLVADFDGNGYPDLIWVNLAGPVRALINDGGDARWLKVAVPDAVTSLGAVITLELSDGRSLVHEVVTGEGLCSDQTHVAFFGLGAAEPTRAHVRFGNGETSESRSPAVGATIEVEPPRPETSLDASPADAAQPESADDPAA